MSIDLKQVFAPLVCTATSTLPIKTIICDTMGTLLLREGLNKPLHDFLLWAKEQGATIYLVSTFPKGKGNELYHAGCDERLLARGVVDKALTVNLLKSKNIAYAAFDDSMLEDVRADIGLNPEDGKVMNYLRSRAYIAPSAPQPK